MLSFIFPYQTLHHKLTKFPQNNSLSLFQCTTLRISFNCSIASAKSSSYSQHLCANRGNIKEFLRNQGAVTSRASEFNLLEKPFKICSQSGLNLQQNTLKRSVVYQQLCDGTLNRLLFTSLRRAIPKFQNPVNNSCGAINKQKY